MRKVVLFMMTSLDGYFEGPDGDISWHHTDEEFNDFAVEQLNQADTILLGRATYDLMATYWTTQEAIERDPVVAEKMNTYEKVVCSTTLKEVNWENTKLVSENIAEELGLLKQRPGRNIIIFGSAGLSATLIRHHFIDELRMMINPVLIGQGRSFHEGLPDRTKLKLTECREFNSGNVLLCYNLAG